MFDSFESPNAVVADPQEQRSDIHSPQKPKTRKTKRTDDKQQELQNFLRTHNHYTFDLADKASAVSCLLSAILANDKVLIFADETDKTIHRFNNQGSAIGSSLANPVYDNVITIKASSAQFKTSTVIEEMIALYCPKWAFMLCHSDKELLMSLSNVCLDYEVMGLACIDSNSSPIDFSIDDYSGITGWVVPKPNGLAPTHTPISLTNRYIQHIQQRGVYSYEHHPILLAHCWGVNEESLCRNPSLT